MSEREVICAAIIAVNLIKAVSYGILAEMSLQTFPPLVKRWSRWSAWPCSLLFISLDFIPQWCSVTWSGERLHFIRSCSLRDNELITDSVFRGHRRHSLCRETESLSYFAAWFSIFSLHQTLSLSLSLSKANKNRNLKSFEYKLSISFPLKSCE